MYSTNLHDQLINAALPLKPLTTWSGGACTVTVAVPPTQSTVGVSIDSVRVELSLPSGQTASAEAVNVEDTPNWVATFQADLFATSGFVAQGLTVYLGGTDEHSSARVWIVSKGDLEVKPGDASPSPTGSFVVVKLRDSAPSTPVKGDAYIGGGMLYIYDGSACQTIGVTVDATLTQPGAAADAKAIGDALKGKLDGAATYPAWDETHQYEDNVTVSYGGRIWFADGTPTLGVPPGEDAAWNETSIGTYLSLKQNALSPAQMDAVNSGATAAKVAVWDGYAAQIAQKANASDLPYRLVEPGKWEFSGSGVQSGKEYYVEYESLSTEWTLYVSTGLDEPPWATLAVAQGTENDLAVVFGEENITATRASLPGHLCDRAGNRVVVEGDTTLTLPAANPGYLRDFLVRLEISGSTVPTITFQGQGSEAPNGADEITYETDGDEFPVPDEAGNWVYSFTENCVAHKFVVSLKKVNEVAQGGA